MLIIEYDPIKGKVVPDALIKKWANNILKKYTEFKTIKIVKEETVIMNITVGSSVMIDATRILILEGRLNYKEILYRFKELTIKVNEYATMSNYPKGFCDVHTDILVKLLGYQSKRYQSKKTKKVIKDKEYYES